MLANASNTPTDSIVKADLEYELKCGINIGGTAPWSMPRDSFNRKLQSTLQWCY